MTNTINQLQIKDLRVYIENEKAVSAWGKGIKAYALELLDGLLERNHTTITLDNASKMLLNGARDWSAFSYGGCSLIYDDEIAQRLCADWELRKTNYGEKEPSTKENWLDVQTRALIQAESLIIGCIKKLIKHI